MPGWHISSGGGGGGGGDVVGPASSTDNAIARFDGATGKLLQNSALTIADTTGNIQGPSGGFSITGGTAASNNLTLVSTSNGTKGMIVAGAVNAGETVLVGQLDLNHAGSNYARIKATGTGIDLLASSSGTNKANIQPADVYQFDGANQVAALYNSGNAWAMSSDFTLGWSASTTTWNPSDTGLSRIAAGQIAASNATNGMANNLKIGTTTVNLAGATTTATGLFPAKCVRFGVTYRVTTIVTSGDGGTSFNVGDGTDADLYGATIAFAAGTTGNLSQATADPTVWASAAGDVVFTCVGGTFSGGVVRVNAHYIDLTAPTS